MYLKSLEIQGFKSFPDKTTIQFGNDITAIVGPNGSGKSNISDAIRWVMGEQSTKALRGGKMEDVIFGGTQKRAQVGFAEATLALDNTDGLFAIDAKEIMVTRRYYRSGESEFYINRKSARLRDINELFMDTGLGREGYSNISQGRIDEILSVKSTDRREIFEEAAGISKYRHRKEETEHRLEHTDDNLTRIGDKISELELQVEPLRQQAEKAKKYLAYREELKGLEITTWLQQLDKLAEAAQKAEADFTSANFILQQQHDALDQLYQTAERLQQQLQTEDIATENLRDQITAIDTQRQHYESEVSLLCGKQENNQKNITRIQEELDQQQSRSSGIAQQIQQRSQRIGELTAEIGSLQDQLKSTIQQSQQMAASSDDITHQFVQLQQQQSSLLTRQAGCEADRNATAEQLQQYKQKQQQLLQDCTAAEARCMQTKENLADCQKKLANAQQSVQTVQNAIAGYQLRLKARQDKKDAVQKQYTDLSVKLHTTDAQIRMYQDMERAYKGFSEAVRIVMQQRDRGALQHVYGTVTQLIRTQDAYTVAIETALGGGVQNIVVETEQDAKAAMQLLKRQNSGRATFLPVRTMRGSLLRENGLEQVPGFVGLASELVHYDAKYEGVIRHLLGRIAVVETLDSAISAANRFGHRFKIVTLDGQVMNAGGSMTGGSVGRSSGFLTRANELERLQEDKKSMTQKLQELEHVLQETVRSVEQTAYEVETASGQLRQHEDKVLMLQGEEQQYRVLLGAITASIESTQRERSNQNQQMEICCGRLEKLNTQLTDLHQNLQQVQTALAQADKAQTDASLQHSQTADQITSLKMQISAQEAERNTATEAVAQLRQLETQMHGDRQQKQSLMDTYAQECRQLQQDLESARQLQQQTAQQLQTQRSTLKQALEKRKTIEAQKTKTEKEAQDKNRDILNMERESARLEQKKLSAQMEEKQIVDKLWDSYQLTRSTAVQFQLELESAAAAQRRISELKRKIGQLGTPNLGAVEEFERVNERYEYLTTQRDDVLHAKNDLLAIIRDITVQMTDIFVQEFSKINTYFGETFTEMFGGGKASLELDNPDEPLSCGIEINVQPPGKQLKTITLLSGGEKAFVAIALYFAILKVRPTPFCMLDEIDAALDDRNVERFANYLRTFCSKTQFIVITHRRGTMEEADILYGVTMQEHGVSKILHLDLNQMQQQLGIRK